MPSPKRPATDAAIIAEARAGRLPPGERSPLGALLEALPADRRPQRRDAVAGSRNARERIATAFNATRNLLEGQAPRRQDGRGLPRLGLKPQRNARDDKRSGLA